MVDSESWKSTFRPKYQNRYNIQKRSYSFIYIFTDRTTVFLGGTMKVHFGIPGPVYCK